MQFTFFSFMMSVLGSSILTVLIYFQRRKPYAIHVFGIKMICILYVFVLLRMTVPIEFPFTRVVKVPWLYNQIYEKLCLSYVEIGEISFKPITVLVVVWMLISISLIIRFGITYFRGKRKLLYQAEALNEQYQVILDRLEREQGVFFSKFVKIVVTPYVSAPMGMGVFQKVILLPDIVYSEEEMYYILLHEYTHFQNKDILVKIFIYLYCCIFWWNPFSYLLEKDLAQLLEIKCDATIVDGMEEKKIADYLSAIVGVLKKRKCTGGEAIGRKSAISLLSNSPTLLAERFTIVSNSRKESKKKRYWKLVWALTFVCVFLSSYIFIFQAAYDTKVSDIETEPGAKVVTPEEYYIIQDEYGIYILKNGKGDSFAISKEFANMMISQGFEMKEEP